jgi:hypothetical protein
MTALCGDAASAEHNVYEVTTKYLDASALNLHVEEETQRLKHRVG